MLCGQMDGISCNPKVCIYLVRSTSRRDRRSSGQTPRTVTFLATARRGLIIWIMWYCCIRDVLVF